MSLAAGESSARVRAVMYLYQAEAEKGELHLSILEQFHSEAGVKVFSQRERQRLMPRPQLSSFLHHGTDSSHIVPKCPDVH
ncbi:hypothetical protein E2C01_018307 [Portunus trituberculatus]|uniref:Uncharacterized protein n=1 Tax=Portunus trituberculatus TaxID=210409 RepID=A0A5B7DW21_PORTR|nr:hypothetical protein [Portunus trituberculatus]